MYITNYNSIGEQILHRTWQQKEYIRGIYPEGSYTEETRNRRKKQRQKYHKPGKNHQLKLQTLSLQAYSSTYNISIDSIEIYIQIGQGSGLKHKLILEDKRPIPLHFHTLRPWTLEEIETVIKQPYLHWYQQGGFHTYKWNKEPAFWIDLWKITELIERPIILEWYLPEVKENHCIHHFQIGEEADHLQEIEGEQPQLQEDL